MKNVQGFTAMEMMLVVALIGIIAATALPAVNSFMDKQRLIDAAEAVYTQLVYARSEAITRSNDVYVNFFVDPADVKHTTWAIGVSTNSNCDPAIADPTAADACVLDVAGQNVLKRINSADYPGMALTPNTDQVDFDKLRGTVTPGNNGTFRVTNKNRELQIIVSVIGRVRICMDPDNKPVGGYSPC